AHDLLDLGADAVGHAGQVRRELPELRVVRLEGAHGVSSPGWLVRSSTHSRSCSQAYDDRPSEATDSTVPVSQAGALSSTDRTRTRAPTSWSSAPRGSDTVTRRRVTSGSADSVSRPWTGSSTTRASPAYVVLASPSVSCPPELQVGSVPPYVITTTAFIASSVTGAWWADQRGWTTRVLGRGMRSSYQP